jgi:hypothetical protein
MKRIGLWIDHKKAVIVTENQKGESIQQIESGVGRHVSYRGASHPKSPYSAQYQQGDDQLDNKYTEQLKKFYDKIIALMRDAEAVFIMGPGEAKLEFEKRLVHDKINVRVVGVEAADKMTDPQIAVKVRKHFEGMKIHA